MDALYVSTHQTLGRTLLAAGLFTALAAASLGALRDDAVTRRLSLQARTTPNAYYLSAWDRGDVAVRFPDDKLQGVVFHNRAWLTDGCRWQGTETLTPISANEFFYEYAETILECEPGATPYFKTPRTGIVRVTD